MSLILPHTAPVIFITTVCYRLPLALAHFLLRQTRKDISYRQPRAGISYRQPRAEEGVGGIRIRVTLAP